MISKASVAKKKIEAAMKILDEVVDRFVRLDVDSVYFERKAKTIPHSKNERKEVMQKQMASENGARLQKVLIETVVEKIREYEVEEEEVNN